MIIDWARPVRTADDKPARLLANDLGGNSPFAVAVQTASGERVFRVNEEGVSPENANLNLKNLIIDLPVWVNVYLRPGGELGIGGKTFTTALEASNNVRDQRRIVGRNEITLGAVFEDV